MDLTEAEDIKKRWQEYTEELYKKDLHDPDNLCDSTDCSPPGSSVHGESPGQNSGVGCHALLQGIFPTQGSNPGLPHCRWILYHMSHQGSPRILEWVAYSFSKGEKIPTMELMKISIWTVFLSLSSLSFPFHPRIELK